MILRIRVFKKGPDMMAHFNPGIGEVDRWFQGAHWPPSLASLVSSMLIRSLVSKTKDGDRDMTPEVVFWYSHPQSPTLTQHLHTHTNTTSMF